MEKLKNQYLKINEYLNNNWLIIFLTVVGFFFFRLINRIYVYGNTEHYHNIHNEIFVISVICFISIYFMRASVLWFLIPFLFARIISFHFLFDRFQNYIFNESPFSHLFDNLASKDMNVIFISFFLIYMIGVLIFLIIYKLAKKKWHLKSVFLFITLFVYLITTFLFHYFLIEKNYRHLINNELKHMEKVAESDEKYFPIICKNQEYICADSDEEIKKMISDKNFDEYIVKYPGKYKIKGNFSIGKLDNIFLIVRNDNKWVINTNFAKHVFNESGNYLMICLDIAHTFWLFFFIWLNVFHFRKLRS